MIFADPFPWVAWGVASGYAASAVAPFVARIARGKTGLLLALLPACLCALFTFLLLEVGRSGPLRIARPWTPSLDVELAFRLDGLSLFFALLVSGIGASIFVYANGYFGDKPGIGRFYALLLAFMASMLGLVLADDLILLYVFFELTSLTSYGLISFDHAKPAARANALQALLVTVPGGLCLLAAVVLITNIAGTQSLTTLLAHPDVLRESAQYPAILALVVIAAFTKSAQVPFHFWLPNAMVAPTPVSAYLHSATMVKAGIFLLMRLFPFLAGTPAFFFTLVTLGATTMLVGGFCALRATDLKQVLAFATIMALGLLTAFLGFGSPHAVQACIVYLLVHALYKAALFMGVGAIDHETKTREITALRGLRARMPFVFAATFLAALSMAGLPPAFGFVGKEMVYEAALDHGVPGLVLLAPLAIAFAFVFAAAGLVAIRPFLGAPSDAAKKASSSAPSLWLPPLLLALAGMLAGAGPDVILGPSLLGPAAAAVLDQPVALKLALFHGWTPALALSVLTVLLGSALYLRWDVVRSTSLFGPVEELFMRGFPSAFDAGLARLHRIAVGITHALQNGSLRFYTSMIILTFVAVLGTSIVEGGIGPIAVVIDPRELAIHEWILAALVVAGAMAALYLRFLLGALITLSVVGIALALIYLAFGAPDVAIAQFVVETLLLVLLMLVFVSFPEEAEPRSQPDRIRDALLALGAGTITTIVMLEVLAVPFDLGIAAEYAARSVPEAHGRNVVNTILADFRALDTMGEVLVLATAALGVYPFLRRPPFRVDPAEPEEPSKGAPT